MTSVEMIEQALDTLRRQDVFLSLARVGETGALTQRADDAVRRRSRGIRRGVRATRS